MRVALRFIYNKAAAPSCHIIDMNNETWNQFLYGDQKLIACQLLGMESEADKIHVVSWMPIEGLEEILQTSPAKTITKIFDKSTLRMYLQPFLEINTPLSCNHVSRIVNIVKEKCGYGKKQNPTVNDLAYIKEEEVSNSNRLVKRNFEILKVMLLIMGCRLESIKIPTQWN